MVPPPTSTWCATVLFDGFSWSRFGPTLPLEPAAFSVWHPPQPAEAKTALPSGFDAVVVVFPVVVAGAAVSAITPQFGSPEHFAT
jgi:hypothetical protein